MEFLELSPIEATITIKGKPSKEIIEKLRKNKFYILLNDMAFSEITFIEESINGTTTTFGCVGITEVIQRWKK